MNQYSNVPPIRWEPPIPRKGFAGMWDKFVGPGTTRAELWLQLVPAFVAGIAVPLYATLKLFDWTTAQLILSGLLALDLVGGVITNATSAAQRWYHREGQGFKEHFGFVALHAMQIFLVAWFFRDGDWVYFATIYGYLLLATLIILRTKLYLQRPLALLLYLGAVMLDRYGFTPIPGMEWFAPVFFLKLLVSHLLKEAPYEPF